jgi:hypothetical protein
MAWIADCVLALGLVTAAASGFACGGSSAKPAADPDTPTGGDVVPDPVCCCQRYDQEGTPTGAGVSDRTACKSTGGTCTDDETQCSED